ncbi:MAG: response regulator transcription factor [Patescibacteria group bacterium]|nr:response regulator transcription factor [Patescibacteria group bacterium]MDE1965748.1 response regulator transcription factor [Patescibacteria group bacterium]
MRILIVEDEAKLADALSRGLTAKGYAVDIIDDGEKALTRVSIHHDDYDAVILDLMLPSLDGLAVCRSLRERDIVTPVLVLTARAETETKVELLLSGADDYLVKPFSFEELLARIQSLLRRPHASVPLVLKSGSIELNPVEHTVRLAGQPVELTLKEFNLLEYFLRRPNEVVNREDLLAHLWDFNYESFSNVIDVHVKNLRRKLGAGDRADALETVRGIGYRLRA